jgi:serine/threonine-protein kinase
MSQTFICPNGHRWEADSDATAVGAEQFPPCPVCSGLYSDPPPPRAPLAGARALGEQIVGPAERTALDSTNPPDDGLTGPRAPAVLDFPQLPGYEILSVLGHGGMGVVYQARQIALKRLVALKMILTGGHAGPDERDRFRAEAEAVARLQHPNIVQVYETGEHKGRPFFSLEYVAGGSLALRLAEKPLAPREAAALVQTLARAMHYAHEHGVVHRDLKPANVLLAADGTPKITDFGLAKRLDDDSTRTRTGVVMGTPSYMAPEQASGHSRGIGPTADVYALGAILYEALTGRPPFKAASVFDTLEQVRYREPVPPSRLQDKLPRDLETICLKCLSKEPDRRYATAQELADDLAAFLVGRPIKARPIGPGERMLKWARRHPAVTGLIAVSIAALVTLLAGGIWYNTRLTRALASAEVERRRAEANFLKAREAVDAMLTEVGDQRLAQVPQMEPVRKALLEKALHFYEGFLQERSSDPAVRRETARAYQRTAEIYQLLGQHDQSEESLRQALLLQEQLAEKYPEEPGYRQDEATSRHALGNLYYATGRLEQAESLYKQSLALRDALVRTYPEAPEYIHELAKTYQNLATIYALGGRMPRAEEALQKALELRRQPAIVTAHNPAYQEELAKTQTNLGNVYLYTQRWHEGEQEYKQGVAVFEELVRDHPGVPKYQNELGGAYNNLGDLYRNLGRSADAEASCRRAVELREQLVRDHPRVLDYVTDLASSQSALGSALRDDGKEEEALTSFKQAVSALDDILRQSPQNSVARRYLQQTLTDRGDALERLGRHADALQDFERALTLAPEQDKVPIQVGRAVALAGLGRSAEAVAGAEAAARTPAPQGETLYSMARVYGLAGAATGQDVKVPPAERTQRSQEYGQRAVELLAKAKAAGFFKEGNNLSRLAHDEAFAQLRHREDFRSLAK